MDRREFFKRGFSRLRESAIEGVQAHVNTQASHWVRPPYALDELDFLLACNRCGDCIKACPHGVIFALPLRRGIKAAATPALDLLHNACRLCKDWPCVHSCETGALRLPECADAGEMPLPVIAIARVETDRCLPYIGPECGACQGACPVTGAMQWDQGKPRIDPDLCIGCALCREACILKIKAISIHSRHQAV